MKTKNAHLRRGCVKQGEKKKIMLAERRVWVRTGSFLDQDQAWRNREEIKQEVRSHLLVVFCGTNHTIFWAWPFQADSNGKSSSTICRNLKARYASSKLPFSYSSKWGYFAAQGGYGVSFLCRRGRWGNVAMVWMVWRSQCHLNVWWCLAQHSEKIPELSMSVSIVSEQLLSQESHDCLLPTSRLLNTKHGGISIFPSVYLQTCRGSMYLLQIWSCGIGLRFL